jgi:hypothetical protein
MLLCAVALGEVGATAQTLTIEVDRERPWRLLLSGTINVGDAERVVRKLVDPLSKKPFLVAEVVLNSPGGNLAESQRLASLIKNLHLNTRIRAGGSCSSACFFVFLSGVQRLAGERNGSHLQPGRIGLHRPYLKGSTLKIGDPTNVMDRQQAEMAKVTDYLRRESVPLKLIDEMMTHPSNDIYWMTEDDLWKLGEYHPSFEEVLIARCGYDKRLTSSAYAQMLERSGDEAGAEGRAQLATLWQCITHTRATFDDKRDAFVAKLKAGWRPWAVTPY